MGQPVIRSGLDSHVGHASPTPNPFHKTAYTGGSPNVNTNGAKTIRKGDATSCGDPAVGASSTVFVNGRVFTGVVTQQVVMVVGCQIVQQVEVLT